MAGTKNLGQVAGLYIGTSAPSNTTLIWYDSTPAIQCHKVYNEQLQQWVVLDSSVISAITYQVLKNLAQGQGLSVGQWFKITDKSNALALAITSTKVQYVDNIGNILIDDLGGSIQYCVTHTNLLIDDIVGVWDAAAEKVIFRFDVVTPNFLGDDFILAKSKRNNIWSLVKYKISDFLSTNSGNAISWNNGFYLDFQARFSSLLDVPGGAVSKSTFDSQIASINQTLTNVSDNVQNVQQQAASTIAAAVTDAQVYSKKLPAAPTAGAGADILQGDTLSTIINKIHRWIQQLKWATGIGLSASYAEATQLDYVNNNDSVETAIGKLAFWVRTFGNYNANGTDSVILSGGYSPSPGGFTPGTSDLTTVLENFAYHLGVLDKASGVKLDGTYSPQNNTITAGQSTVLQAIEKIVFDITAIQRSNYRLPLYSILSYGLQPKYDNMISNNDFRFPGYGWFPCGCFFVGTQADCLNEKNKWEAKYGAGNISWASSVGHPGYLFNGQSYGLRMDSYNGVAIPNTSDKWLNGLDEINPSEAAVNQMYGSGGNRSHGITTAEMPKHNHVSDSPYDDGDITTSSDGLHKHYIFDDRNGSYSTTRSYTDDGADDNAGRDDNGMTSAGVHTHTVSLKAVGGGSSNGIGQAFDMRTPFITVAFIIRLV